MKQILKQVLGVDVAQKELVVTLGRMHNDFTLDLYAYKIFKNDKTGFANLFKWLNPLINRDVNPQFVMEATGVYHQKFAYYLHEKGCNLSIVLPNKISNYMQTLDVKNYYRQDSFTGYLSVWFRAKIRMLDKTNKSVQRTTANYKRTQPNSR